MKALFVPLGLLCVVSLGWLFNLAGAGAAPASMPVAPLIPFAAGGTWIDLTHEFAADTLYWPTAQRFQLEVESRAMTPKGYFYAANRYRASEHGGTHIDAPIHFAEKGKTVDQLPIDQLLGAAVVVDVSAQAAATADYQVSVADFEAWEKAHGQLPQGIIVLLRTGYAKRWPDPKTYLGTEMRGAEAVPQLHFPGLHPDAARWLVAQRSIKAIGLDTASIDYGQSSLFESHRILLEKNIPAFENVGDMSQLPATGLYIIALPMKIKEGSGGPLRIVAWMPGKR
ncbi:cyclase family protein [Prosthecobacter sp.]|uniref:cyclase family protein n=1 Tax=Prosthecobacter sp. TaxID=1965333 RepID=UPI003783001E